MSFDVWSLLMSVCGVWCLLMSDMCNVIWCLESFDVFFWCLICVMSPRVSGIWLAPSSQANYFHLQWNPPKTHQPNFSLTSLSNIPQHLVQQAKYFLCSLVCIWKRLYFLYEKDHLNVWIPSFKILVLSAHQFIGAGRLNQRDQRDLGSDGNLVAFSKILRGWLGWE